MSYKSVTIVSDIDSVVTRPEANRGNYAQVGQELMAFRPITEICTDANFKAFNWSGLRIGQRVRCEVDTFRLGQQSAEMSSCMRRMAACTSRGLTAAWAPAALRSFFSIVNPEECPSAR